MNPSLPNLPRRNIVTVRAVYIQQTCKVASLEVAKISWRLVHHVHSVVTTESRVTIIRRRTGLGKECTSRRMVQVNPKSLACIVHTNYERRQTC